MKPSRKRKPIGVVIKTARVRRNLKAEDVAEVCNVSRSRIFQWEKSDYVLPKNLKGLSAALKIPLERLRMINESRGAA